MRITNQREIILEELKKTKSHPTADELFELVRKRLPRISLATVYRNLEQLSDAGIINKIEYGSRQKRFDGDVSPHSHVFCIRCGKIADIKTAQDINLKKIIQDTKGYKIFGERLQFMGLCPQCQEEEANKNN